MGIGVHISSQKLGDRADDRLLLVFAQLGEDGQGQEFAGGALGFGEAALWIDEALQRLLRMERDRDQ